MIPGDNNTHQYMNKAKIKKKSIRLGVYSKCDFTIIFGNNSDPGDGNRCVKCDCYELTTPATPCVTSLVIFVS